MPKVLILTGDAAEDLEVMYPYQRLLEEGYEVDVAAPTVKTLQFVVHDFVDGFRSELDRRCRRRSRSDVPLPAPARGGIRGRRRRTDREDFAVRRPRLRRRLQIGT